MEGYRSAVKLMPGFLLIALVPIIVSSSSCTPTSEAILPMSTMVPATVDRIEATEEMGMIEPEVPPTEPEEKLSSPTPELMSATDAPATEIAPTTATDAPATASPDLISLPALDTNRPMDVMQEVGYFVGGGGGATDCYGVYQDAWDSYQPHLLWTTPDEEANWLNGLSVDTCGWLPQEQVALTISSNNAVVDARRLEADEWGSVWIGFLIEVEHAPGLYHFFFAGESGEVAAEIWVNSPVGPTLYHFFDEDKADTGQLLFHGFHPGEMVRLVVYEGRGSKTYSSPFKGWTTVQADGSGQLFVMSDLVSTEENHVSYAAVGELSGEAMSLRRYVTLGLRRSHNNTVYIPIAEEACAGEIQTRLSIGAQARVVADRLSVREGPGTSYSTVYGTSLSDGRAVTITGGPVCSDAMVWWYGETGLITLTNGAQHNIVGWMAEESGGDWLLEPVP